MILSPGLTILLSLTVFVLVLFLYILSGMVARNLSDHREKVICYQLEFRK